MAPRHPPSCDGHDGWVHGSHNSGCLDKRTSPASDWALQPCGPGSSLQPQHFKIINSANGCGDHPRPRRPARSGPVRRREVRRRAAPLRADPPRHAPVAGSGGVPAARRGRASSRYSRGRPVMIPSPSRRRRATVMDLIPAGHPARRRSEPPTKPPAANPPGGVLYRCVVLGSAARSPDHGAFRRAYRGSARASHRTFHALHNVRRAWRGGVCAARFGWVFSRWPGRRGGSSWCGRGRRG